MHEHRTRVILSHHARRRLSERFPEINKKQYRQLATAARYKGLTAAQLEQSNSNIAEYISTLLKYNSSQIRVYKDIIFIFRGQSTNAHVLVTVFGLKDCYKQIQEEMEERCEDDSENQEIVY